LRFLKILSEKLKLKNFHQIGKHFLIQIQHKELETSLLLIIFFLVLKVPSAVVQEEYNYLVNPNHRDFHKVKIIAVEPFTFDERLFKK